MLDAIIQKGRNLWEHSLESAPVELYDDLRLRVSDGWGRLRTLPGSMARQMSFRRGDPGRSPREVDSDYEEADFGQLEADTFAGGVGPDEPHLGGWDADFVEGDGRGNDPLFDSAHVPLPPDGPELDSDGDGRGVVSVRIEPGLFVGGERPEPGISPEMVDDGLVVLARGCEGSEEGGPVEAWGKGSQVDSCDTREPVDPAPGPEWNPRAEWAGVMGERHEVTSVTGSGDEVLVTGSCEEAPTLVSGEEPVLDRWEAQEAPLVMDRREEALPVLDRWEGQEAPVAMDRREEALPVLDRWEGQE
ncbi:MAG: hypothetical protein HQL59_13920, partial [Magnetococcales bacterium]|nr:hypothetical protein [Magnetococcales bacterium]